MTLNCKKKNEKLVEKKKSVLQRLPISEFLERERDDKNGRVGKEKKK